jgi:hypothetical protein
MRINVTPLSHLGITLGQIDFSRVSQFGITLYQFDLTLCQIGLRLGHYLLTYANLAYRG